jgi:uncharacterized membrane protein YcaP (DUF421 family)
MRDFVERLLIGDGPWAFLAEVVARAVIMYLILLVSMRLMGKRVAAQLSITELAVILMLSAAIGVPIQVSSQGVLPAVVVLLTVVCLQRASSLSALRWRRVELLTQGEVSLVARDGRILLEKLRENQMSREMLASELRAADVAHRGELRRVYLESSGALSIIRRKRAVPGLTMRPDRSASCYVTSARTATSLAGVVERSHSLTEDRQPPATTVVSKDGNRPLWRNT